MRNYRFTGYVVAVVLVVAVICGCSLFLGRGRHPSNAVQATLPPSVVLEILDITTGSSGHKHTTVVYKNPSPPKRKGFIWTHESKEPNGHITVIKEIQFTEQALGKDKMEIRQMWESGTDSSGRKYKKLVYNNPEPEIHSDDNFCVKYPLSDGKILLVKNGKALGAVILRNQRTPTTHGRAVNSGLEWEWYYRTDGKGTFRPNDGGKFYSGKGSLRSSAAVIEFGPFAIFWGECIKGKGWIEYDEFGHPRPSGDHTAICVTQETDIAKVDAASNRWTYKASQSDPGIHADGSKVH